MDFLDASGTRYQLTETSEAPAAAKKAPVWPWVVGGLAVAGGLVWMASASSSKKANPVNLDQKALIEEARDPTTSFSRMEELQKHPDEEVRRALLDNPNVCPFYKDGRIRAHLLEALTNEFPEEVGTHPLFLLHTIIDPVEEAQWIVERMLYKTADGDLICQLYRTWEHKRSFIRKAVASNPNTPEDLLRLLGNPATEDYEDVRYAVARNPSTPLDVLRLLGNQAIEREHKVREAVAENTNTPVDVLLFLKDEATESDIYVRYMANSFLKRR